MNPFPCLPITDRLLLIACVTLCFVSSARAATNTVTTLNDFGVGSLRSTIATAASGDTIVFAPGSTGTITLITGELIISQNLTIIGPGRTNLTVSGNGTSRVFRIPAGDVSISGLTIANGDVPATLGNDAKGGGILNEGNLTLTACVVANNSAIGLDSLGLGGGIHNVGNLTLTACFVSGNFAASSGGGIYSLGTLILGNCTVSGNRAFSNGAGGGGISFSGTSSTLINCTIAGNSAIGYDDELLDPYPGKAYGGGILVSMGSVGLTHCTIANNFAGGTAGVSSCSGFGGGISINNASLTIKNTLVADNWIDALNFNFPLYQGEGFDVRGAITSMGFNLIGVTNASTGWNASDLTGALGGGLILNPQLGPLRDNGGPTWTMGLLPGSPAIDAGTGGGFTTDQRGVPRPLNDPTDGDGNGGDGSDIGAYELGYTLTASVVGSGSVLPNPNQGIYVPNSPVMLTATPSPGWGFAVWSGDASGTSNPLNIVMTTNKFITANFFQPSLIASANPPGGIVIKNPDQVTQAYGSTAMLTAVPLVGYAFAGWSGAASGTQNPLPVLMTSTKSIYADFVPTISDMIVDNTNATFTGSWTTDSGSGGNEFFATDFRYATTVASATGTATFRPTLPLSGKYDVYVWFPSITPGSQRCGDAQYFISASSSNASVSVDQSSAGAGEWLLIASGRKFSQGTNGFVRLSNQSTDTGRRVAADAVRWVWSTNQVTQPYITSVIRGLTDTTLTWLSGSNQVYRLQYKTNLTDANWFNLSGDVPATSNTVSKTDSTLGNAPQRFYRVQLLP